MEKKTLMQQLIEAGYPREEMFNHESDLYVFVTSTSKPIVEAFYKELGYDRSWHAPIFHDLITKKPMYDCAFQYDDWLKERNEWALKRIIEA